jgi:hypothetical protein
MNALILKTRIKNKCGQDTLFRWIAPRGQYLTVDQEIIVDGAYPSMVENRRFISSCEYDIIHGRVEVELITNMQTRKPTKAEEKDAGDFAQPAPAAVPPSTEPATELNEQTKVDERWQSGTIEEAKPKPITLPGHEDTLTAEEPKTLEIFPEGATLENEQDPLKAAGKLSTEVGADLPADAPEEPEAEPVPTETVAEASEETAQTAQTETEDSAPSPAKKKRRRAAAKS